MRRPAFIARQSRRPSGPLGWFIGRVMAYETAAANDALLDVLAALSTDSVLEIGFGHGRTIARLAAAASAGFVAGIDHSEVMLRIAQRRNRVACREGRVQLRVGDSARLPFPDGRFDKVLAVHTLYFWEEPSGHLAECRRVLRPGGRLLLGYRPGDDPASGDYPDSVYRFYARPGVVRLVEEAGFHPVVGKPLGARHGTLEYVLAATPAAAAGPS